MACYRPITAWKPEDGPILFAERKDCREIQIKCGSCIGCRIERREAWAVRCVAESKMHEVNSFVTLTYDDAHMPQNGSLNYRDFQLFMKRLRRKVGPVRFFMCGEYGAELMRPHYHALFFGLNFGADRVKCNSLRSSADIYRSETLEQLWPYGFSSIGDVTYASARYCATYTVKKITGQRAVDHYSRVVPSTGEIVQLEPEFGRMSLKPGIGESWLRKYWRDLYDVHDAFIIEGRKVKVPRYFDLKMDSIAPVLMDSVEYARYLKCKIEDNTAARLAAREKVAIAKANFEIEKRGSSSEV